MATCHLPIAIALVLLLSSHISAQSGGSSSNSSGSSSGASAQANAELSSSGGSTGVQASGSIAGLSGSLSAGASVGSSSSGSDSGSSGSSGSSSGSSGGGSSGSSSSSSGGSSSSLGSGSSSSGSSGSASASISAGSSSSSSQGNSPWLNSTPKPEGFFGRIKDVVKSSVDNLTQKEAKKEQPSNAPPPSTGGASLGSGETQAQSSSNPGIMDKLSDAAKKAKEMVKDGAKEVKDEVKTVLGAKGGDDKGSSGGSGGGSGSSGSGSSGSGGGLTASAGVKIGGTSLGGNLQLGAKAESKSESKSSENPLSKLIHKVEDKASEFGDKLTGDGKKSSGGESRASASAQIKVGDSNSGSAQENKSLAVNVIDKMHEISKAPVEAAMKPIDKALGFEKDPFIKAYDSSHEMLRKPLSVVAKPVEEVLAGAFKTSDEAKMEQEKSMSEQERREMRMKEERARKEGRSVLGGIADKTFELAEKPYEIILKPVDHLLGFDKDGQKDPIIKLFDEIYGMSKKPIDVLAKPFENILKKMAEGEQAYQVSVRFNSDKGADPKLITRLADGALNIADRVMTKPLEIAMRPLGYDGHKKKNPIVESTHQLKNATKLGLELFTRPIDRIIKEIAELGVSRNEAEQDAERERKRQEASRIVRVLDKLHEAAQTPWEIVLRPVGRALGYNRDGKKEPLLRAWDVVHQVIRTPIQVLTKPVEDVILGEQKRQPPKAGAKAELKIGKTGVQGQAQVGSGSGSASASAGKREEPKKNIFVDGIKKWEKFATRPLDKITSPIRRLILGEDDKMGRGAKGAQAQAQVGGARVQAKAGTASSSGGPDKIVKTLEQMNNVVLKPFEVVTQPIADMLSPEEKDKKKSEVKVQAKGSASSGQGGGQATAQASAQVKKN